MLGRAVYTKGRKAMSEQNRQVALKFLKAMGENNAAEAAECLAPDAFTLAKGFSKFAGVRHRDTILGMIEAFKEMMPEGLKLEFQNVIADGDCVAVEAEGHAMTSEGKPYYNQYCFVVRLKDGKVAQVNEYFCSKLAEEVLWPLVENQQHLHSEAAG